MNDVAIESDMTPSIAALAASLAKAQGQMTGAKKDSTNPHFQRAYADLASVWDAIRAPLSANGLAVIQTTEPAQGGVCIVTMLAHASGEWIRSRLTMPAQKQDAQGIGSAITYARRYALAAICGIAPEDDDGEGAAQRGSNGSARPAQAPAPVTPIGKASRSDAEEAKGYAHRITDAGMAGDRDGVLLVWHESEARKFSTPIAKRLGEVKDEALKVCDDLAEKHAAGGAR